MLNTAIPKKIKNGLFSGRPSVSANWDLLEPNKLYFTMTNIIAVLPKLYRNDSIALRFCNNGLEAFLHHFIFFSHNTSHKTQSLNVDGSNLAFVNDQDLTAWHRNSIVKKYQDARWNRAKPLVKADKKCERSMTNPKWIRRTHPNRDKFWDDKNISMTTYTLSVLTHKINGKPARNIPCVDLAKGVSILPQRDDVGDLTRTLVFALDANALRDEDYLFPEDMHIIKVKFPS